MAERTDSVRHTRHHGAVQIRAGALVLIEVEDGVIVKTPTLHLPARTYCARQLTMIASTPLTWASTCGKNGFLYRYDGLLVDLETCHICESLPYIEPYQPGRCEAFVLGDPRYQMRCTRPATIGGRWCRTHAKQHAPELLTV
jgi:hypothetical protein